MAVIIAIIEIRLYKEMILSNIFEIEMLILFKNATNMHFKRIENALNIIKIFFVI